MNALARLVPHPVLSALLVLVWLLFRQSLAPGTWLTGGVLALLLGRWYARLEPPPVTLRRLHLLPLLALRVSADIVRSNFAVARIVLYRRRGIHSGFVTIPLALENRYGLAMLGAIITSTPGTIWVSHDPEARELLIHVLDLIDEATWITSIKRRYESILLEVFP